MRRLVENDYIAGEKEFKGLYQPLMKLSDHVNLEIGRYSYYSINEQKVSDLEKKNQTLQEDLKQATKELNNAKQSVSSVQTELIAVLSIFAANGTAHRSRTDTAAKFLLTAFENLAASTSGSESPPKLAA